MKAEIHPPDLKLDRQKPWGFGFRPQHADELLKWPQLPCLEMLLDHFTFQQGGPQLDLLDRLIGLCPLFLHGLHLDIGGLDPLDFRYLKEVKKICAITRTSHYSDHLAFTRLEQRPSFDLLPIPFSKSHLLHVIDRIHQVQDFLGMRLGLENISAYLRYPEDEMPELEFLQKLVDATGCGILLDVNNLYVNAHNFDFDPFAALQNLSPSSIMQYHCSGHSIRGQLLHDTHDANVIEPVWQLLYQAIRMFGWHPVILERDDDEISLDSLMKELSHGLRPYAQDSP